MRHEPPPTHTLHELPDTVQAAIDAVREQLRLNREALPRRTRDTNHDLHHRVRQDMEAQEEHFLQYVETYGSMGRIDDYLDMLAQARATGNVIRTALTTTDPRTRTTRSGTDTKNDRGGKSTTVPPAPASSNFTIRHWLALAVIAIAAAITILATR